MKITFHFDESAKHQVPLSWQQDWQNTNGEVAEFAIPQQGDTLYISDIPARNGRFVVRERVAHISCTGGVDSYQLTVSFEPFLNESTRQELEAVR